MSTGVPTFKVRARVLDVNGAVPTSADSFSFSLNKWNTSDAPNRLIGPATTTGTDWSSWLVADSAVITAASAYYTTYVSLAYCAMFDMLVTALAVSPAVALTHIAGEIYTDETAVTVSFTAELFGPRVDIISYRATPSGSPPTDAITGGTAKGATGAQFNQRYFDLIEDLVPTAPPKSAWFTVGDYWSGGDQTTESWAGGYRMLERLGVNAIALRDLDARHRGIVTDNTDVTRWIYGTYNPPGYTFPYRTDSPGEGGFQPNDLAGWASYFAGKFTDAGCDLADVVLINMLDEPAWYFPEELTTVAAASTALTDFRVWLQGKGLTPADIGHTVWTDVVPVGVSKRSGTLAERRLMQLSLQWFSYYSSLWLGQCTAALRDAIGDHLDVAVNWNNGSGRFVSPSRFSFSASPDSATGAHDWFDYGEHAGESCVFGETYLYDNRGWAVSNLASRLQSVAAQNDIRSGAYLIGGLLGMVPHSGVRKTFAMVGRGLKVIKRYRAGPIHIDVDGYMEQGFRRPDIFTSLAESATMLAAAEDVLGPAQPVMSTVGIVHPRSAQAFDVETDHAILDSTFIEWTASTVDYLCEAISLGTVLQMSNVQPAWLSEDSLTAEALAPFEVIYVTAPNLPAAAQSALKAWAEAGGTLVTFPGTAQKDETNSTLSTLATTGGITEGSYARQVVSTLASWTPLGTVSGVGGSAAALGEGAYGHQSLYRSVVTAPGGATVEATFVDNSNPAITRVAVGSGHRVHFAFWPACSWLKEAFSTGSDLTVFSDTYVDLLRQWVARPVAQAGVVLATEVSEPMVEAPMLAADDSAGVVLINWTAEPKSLDVTLRPVDNLGQPFTPARVYSVQAGDNIPFTSAGDTLSLTTSLAYVDVLKMYKTADGAETSGGAALLMVA